MKPTRIRLLGVASGGGAGKAGAEDGPRVLRELGLIERFLLRGYDVEELGDIPGDQKTSVEDVLADSVNNMPRVLQVNRHTRDCILRIQRQRRKDDFLLIIGGDHSLAIGTLAGLSDTCSRLGLLWIDAHADFNTPRTSPSGNAHGMSLAVACGHGHRELRAIADDDPMVDEGDVYLFGCRDLDPGEIANLAESRVNLQTMAQWRDSGVIDSILAAARALAARCDHVHVSFDIDVLDAAAVPGTGTPVTGGLSPAEAGELLGRLGGLRVLSSAEIVEYNPSLDDGSRRTGQLTRDLIDTLLSAMR